MAEEPGRNGAGVPRWALVFSRDVLASLLATGLATFAFTVPGHREPPVPPGTFGPTGKLVERLGEDGTEPLARALRTYETIALLGRTLPDAARVARSEPPVRVAAARSDEAPHRPVAVLPPERPRASPAIPALVVATAALPGPQPVRLLGWAIPGSETLPSRDEAIGRLASLGNTVGTLGSTLVDGIRLP